MQGFLHKPFTCNTINQVISEEKIKKWKVYGQRTCDGNISDELLGQGELKNHSPTLFIDKLYVKLKFASALTFLSMWFSIQSSSDWNSCTFIIQCMYFFLNPYKALCWSRCAAAVYRNHVCSQSFGFNLIIDSNIYNLLT